jgi:hypothetical protein
MAELLGGRASRQGEEDVVQGGDVLGERTDRGAVRVGVVEQVADVPGGAVGGHPDHQRGPIHPDRPVAEPGQQLLEPDRAGRHQVDPLLADPGLQLGGAALRDDPAAVQDGDPTGQPVDLLQVLGGQEHRGAGRGQLGDQLPGLLPAAWVQTGGRLIQEDHLGFADQPGRHVELAAHPAGVAGHRPPAGLGQLEPVEQLLGPASGVHPVQSDQPADHHQVLPAGLAVVHGGVLAGQADPPADLVTLPDDVEPGHPGLAGVRAGQGGQDPHRGGLAGAVRAEQAEHGAARHGQVDPVEHGGGPVGLAQTLDLESRVCVGHTQNRIRSTQKCVVNTQK